MINPKSQAPNPKQIQDLKFQCSKKSLAPVVKSSVLVIGILVIRICLGFEYGDLELDRRWTLLTLLGLRA
jgi:hypothetical protein